MDYNYIDFNSNSNISGIPMSDFNNQISYEYVINNLDAKMFLIYSLSSLSLIPQLLSKSGHIF